MIEKSGYTIRNYSEDISDPDLNEDERSGLRMLAHLLLPHVYISAPYAFPDPIENTNKAIRIADELYTTGVCMPILPHLTLLWNTVIPHEPSFWSEYCLLMMRRCDAILRIDGISQGAEKELVEAKKVGIPIFYQLDHLSEWLESGPDV